MHQCSFTVVTDLNDRSVVFLLIFRNAIAGQWVQFTLKSLMTVQNRMLWVSGWLIYLENMKLLFVIDCVIGYIHSYTDLL